MTSLSRMPFRSNSFSSRVISVFTSRIVNLFLLTVVNIVIARQLGPVGKGIISISIIVPSMLTTICHLGIGSANTYYGSKDELLLSKLLSNSITYGIILSIIIAVCYFSFMPFYHKFLGEELNKQYVIICFWIFPLNLIWGYLASIVLALQRIHGLAFGRVMHNMAYLVLVIVGIALFKNKVAFVLIAMLLSYIIEMLWDFRIIIKDIPLTIKNDFSVFKKQLLFGLQGHAGNLFDFINNRFDLLLVNFFLNVSLTGIYSVSVMLAEMIFFIPGAVSTVLFPVTASYNKEHADKFTPEVCRHNFFWSIILAIIIGVIAKPVINIFFTEKFSESILPLWLLLPGVVALSVNKVISIDLMGRGKPILITYSSGVAAFCTIILDIILIPMWGVPGAAIASSSAYLISTVIILYLFMKESDSKLKELFLPTHGDFRYYGTRIKAVYSSITIK